jgi:hypothetical protein
MFHFSFFETKCGSFFSFRNLIIIAIVGRILNALFLMYLQYSLWSQGGMETAFLNSPISHDIPIEGIKNFEWLFNNKFGYFLFYSWGRFWLSLVITFVVSYGFYGLLHVFKLKNERFFNVGEVELGLLCALIVGWPSFVLFVPLVFLSVVLISIVRLLLFKEKYTTLGGPFILACAFVIIFGSYLVSLFGLGVLKV